MLNVNIEFALVPLSTNLDQRRSQDGLDELCHRHATGNQVEGDRANLGLVTFMKCPTQVVALTFDSPVAGWRHSRWLLAVRDEVVEVATFHEIAAFYLLRWQPPSTDPSVHRLVVDADVPRNTVEGKLVVVHHSEIIDLAPAKQTALKL